MEHILEKAPTETPVDQNVVMNNRIQLVNAFKRGCDAFHRYFVYILVASLIGSYVGITAAKKFYESKLDDCVISQALVYKGKPYSITLK